MSGCDHVVGRIGGACISASEMESFRQLEIRLTEEFTFCRKCGAPLRGEWGNKGWEGIGDWFWYRQNEGHEPEPMWVEHGVAEVGGRRMSTDEIGGQWYSLPIAGPE